MCFFSDKTSRTFLYYYFLLSSLFCNNNKIKQKTKSFMLFYSFINCGSIAWFYCAFLMFCFAQYEHKILCRQSQNRFCLIISIKFVFGRGQNRRKKINRNLMLRARNQHLSLWFRCCVV